MQPSVPSQVSLFFKDTQSGHTTLSFGVHLLLKPLPQTFPHILLKSMEVLLAIDSASVLLIGFTGR